MISAWLYSFAPLPEPSPVRTDQHCWFRPSGTWRSPPLADGWEPPGDGEVWVRVAVVDCEAGGRGLAAARLVVVLWTPARRPRDVWFTHNAASSAPVDDGPIVRTASPGTLGSASIFCFCTSVWSLPCGPTGQSVRFCSCTGAVAGEQPKASLVLSVPAVPAACTFVLHACWGCNVAITCQQGLCTPACCLSLVLATDFSSTL